MKNAILWKRILNGALRCGLPEEQLTTRRQGPVPLPVDSLISSRIITAPILVDQRPVRRDFGDVAELPQVSGLAFPFDTLWVESVYADVPAGTLFTVQWDRHNGDRSRGFSFSVFAMAFWGLQDVTLVGTLQMRVSRDGNPIASTAQWSVRDGYIRQTDSLDHGVNNVASWIIRSALDTLMVLGCRNVSLSSRDNDPQQVRRAIKRHGGTPDSYRYHVLVVRPPGAKSDAPAQEIGIMPRHVCRGHFAEYGPEFNKGLLFGKYAGRFFIPPHMKGKKENGIVEKDYAIPA